MKYEYPPLLIDDTLDLLQSSRHLFSIDLRSGYCQIPAHLTDRQKIGFITLDGLYHLNVISFGHRNAHATFDRMVDSLLRVLKWSSSLCYLVDVIIFAPIFAGHLQRL